MVGGPTSKRQVRPSEVKRIMIEAGLVKGNPRNAAPHIYSLLRDSSKFKWVAPGTFELMNGTDNSEELSKKLF